MSTSQAKAPVSLVWETIISEFTKVVSCCPVILPFLNNSLFPRNVWLYVFNCVSYTPPQHLTQRLPDEAWITPLMQFSPMYFLVSLPILQFVSVKKMAVVKISVFCNIFFVFYIFKRTKNKNARAWIRNAKLKSQSNWIFSLLFSGP